MSTQTLKFYAVTLLSIFILAGCGGGGSYGGSSGGGDGDGGTPPTFFTVGGTVTGLSGSVVLQNNLTGDLTVSTSGPFIFATALATDSAYSVTVKTEPANQKCEVAKGTGRIAAANVVDITVTCTTNAPGTFTVSGTVSGLTGSVVLQNNGGDDLPLTADGPFVFSTAIATGGEYRVSVLTGPATQTCEVTDEAGTNGAGIVGTQNVTNVVVVCSDKMFAVHGTVTGLPGDSSVVLQNNDAAEITVSGSGSVPFGNFASGAEYSIRVITQPSYPAYDCTAADDNGDGDGTIGSADITVAVSCTALDKAVLQSAAPNVKSADLTWNVGFPASPVASFNIYSSATVDFCHPRVSDERCTPVAAAAQSRSLHVARLTNGTRYSFTLETVYENGARDVSTPSRSATPDAVLTFDRRVKAIAVADDGTQYVGGDFTLVTIGGQSRPRGHLAALDATGALLPWNPSVGSTIVSPTVNALAILSGVVYAGGQFTHLNGTVPVGSVAAIQRSDGQPLPLRGGGTWHADVGLELNTPGVVNALAVRRNALYVGGHFRSINQAERINLAAVDASTGDVVLSFRPNPGQARPDSFVSVIVPATVPRAVPPGTTLDVLYVGGRFTGILGFSATEQPLRNAAQIHPTAGFAMPAQFFTGESENRTPYFWPNPVGGAELVSALAVKGSTVYMGGEFTSIRGETDNPGVTSVPVHNLAAVSFDQGVEKRISLPPQPYFEPVLIGGGVNALAVSDGFVYAGGNFTGNSNTGVPDRLAAFSLELDGSPRTHSGSVVWNPGPNNAVMALAVFRNTVYVGGDFTSLARAPSCQRFCALDIDTGEPSP